MSWKEFATYTILAVIAGIIGGVLDNLLEIFGLMEWVR